ncbi:MAG: ion channel [Chloroflexota bacterium]
MNQGYAMMQLRPLSDQQVIWNTIVGDIEIVSTQQVTNKQGNRLDAQTIHGQIAQVMQGNPNELQYQTSSGRTRRSHSPHLEFDITGVPISFFADAYYFLIAAPWHWLAGLAAASYLLINLVFGFLYWLDPNAISTPERATFADAFFFSVQTFSTIGYGTMSPVSLYANLLVTIESFAGMIAVALLTGLLFAKFSRPVARVAFSQTAIVCDRNGIPALQFRIANERKNEIINAELHASALIPETTEEGQEMFRFKQLTLEREHMPLFATAWTAIHPIDELSPLHGICLENLDQKLLSIMVSFAGLDSTFLDTVQAHYLYLPESIMFNCQFVDMMERHPNQRMILHHERLSHVIPVNSEQ